MSGMDDLNRLYMATHRVRQQERREREEKRMADNGAARELELYLSQALAELDCGTVYLPLARQHTKDALAIVHHDAIVHVNVLTDGELNGIKAGSYSEGFYAAKKEGEE